MYQSITLVGRLGRDPEMRYTPSGQAVATFNLAVNRQFTQAGGEVVKETTWFRASVWDKTAENCHQFLKKGSLVLIEGRLVCDPQTGGPRLFTRKDGTPGTAFEVNTGTVRFLSNLENQDGKEGGEAGDYPF
jgi:single-strand DNA-binding protein